MRPPFDLAAIEAGTPSVLAAGHRLLQTFRYDEDDGEHVARLLQALRPAKDATVLDAGCGVGEVCRLMAERRPDLRFIMVNLSPTQLAHCPQGDRFQALLADCHELPLEDACVDAVMFSSALCQMDETVALSEAFRVLRPGGALLVNEPVRIHGDGVELERLLACRALRFEDMLEAVGTAGFPVVRVEWPTGDASHFRSLMGDMAHLLDGVRPLIVKAVKPVEGTT